MRNSLKASLFILSFFLSMPCAFCETARERSVLAGTTFSQVQCEYLNLDWRDIYKKTLKMKFDLLRLGVYWDRIEKEEGVYDFRELDWQLRQAGHAGQKIVLTLGMKAPRWPEYHLPAWLLSGLSLRPGRNVAAQAIIRRKTLQFIETVLTRYRESEEIIAWQVENEPLDRSGPHNWWISRDFLEEEISLVKKIDARKRPVIVNAAAYPNKLLRIFSRLRYIRNPLYQIIDIAEIPALNIYTAIGHEIANLKICLFSRQAEYKKYLGDIIGYAKSRNKKLWITELQAEPWEPGQLVHLKEGAAISCWPESYAQAFNEITSLGIDTVFLWGVEYWHYRRDIHHDDSWIEAVMQILGKPG